MDVNANLSDGSFIGWDWMVAGMVEPSRIQTPINFFTTCLSCVDRPWGQSARDSLLQIHQGAYEV